MKLAALIALLAIPACKKSEPPAPAPIGSDTVAPAPVAPPAPPAAKPIGILAADNDPKIVDAAKATIAACKWDDKTGWESCPALEAFEHVKIENHGDGDPTLVNFMEDPDAKVRGLAMMALIYFGGGKFEHDEGLATRYVTALEKETCVAIDYRMAAEATKIEAKKFPALAERIKAFALSPKSTNDEKVAIAAWWAANTAADNALAYDVSKALAASTDVRVARSAMMGLARTYAGHEDELCTLWNGAVASPDKETAQVAMQLVCGGEPLYTSDEDSHDNTSTGGVRSSEKTCPQADAVLDAIEAVAKAGKIEHDQVYAATNAAESEKVTPLKTKALGVLKTIVENKANGYSRSSALSALVDNDKAEKAYAQKWVADADLKDTVKSINDRK